MAIQVLMQSAPLLHILDNVVHEDEYLAPEVFGIVSRIVYGGIASRSTNRRKLIMPKHTFDPWVAAGTKTTMKIRLVGATIAMMLLLLVVTISTRIPSDANRRCKCH